MRFDIDQLCFPREELFEVLQDQDRDECCPNLYLNCIFRSSHESLDFHDLFDSLEEGFNLPPLFIQLCNGGCRPRHLVGNELNSLLVYIIPYSHPAQLFGVFIVAPFDFPRWLIHPSCLLIYFIFFFNLMTKSVFCSCHR